MMCNGKNSTLKNVKVMKKQMLLSMTQGPSARLPRISFMLRKKFEISQTRTVYDIAGISLPPNRQTMNTPLESRWWNMSCFPRVVLSLITNFIKAKS